MQTGRQESDNGDRTADRQAEVSAGQVLLWGSNRKLRGEPYRRSVCRSTTSVYKLSEAGNVHGSAFSFFTAPCSSRCVVCAHLSQKRTAEFYFCWITRSKINQIEWSLVQHIPVEISRKWFRTTLEKYMSLLYLVKCKMCLSKVKQWIVLKYSVVLLHCNFNFRQKSWQKLFLNIYWWKCQVIFAIVNNIIHHPLLTFRSVFSTAN